MNYYVVKYLHTDMKGWQEHLNSHISYLEKLLKEGVLMLSGPLGETKKDEKEALLIFKVKNKAELTSLIEADPYWYEGLVAKHEILPWTPMFGNFSTMKDRVLIKLSKVFNHNKK